MSYDLLQGICKTRSAPSLDPEQLLGNLGRLKVLVKLAHYAVLPCPALLLNEGYFLSVTIANMRLLFIYLALATQFVYAIVEDVYFAGNGGNSSAMRLCATMPFQCEPPNVCGQDSLTKNWYCCQSGWACFTNSQNCGGGPEGGRPSDQQIGCAAGRENWCCLRQETCTEGSGTHLATLQ